jgi:hypothetical protein
MNLPSSLPRRARAAAFVLAGLAALAQGPVPAAIPAAAVPSFAPFQAIGSYNIFNANRIGYTPGVSQLRVDLITLVGTMEYDQRQLALFDSPVREFRQGLHEGDRIADFTVTKITPTGVVLTRDAKPVTLALGQQLRRPEGGTWSVGVARRAAPAAAAAAPAIPSDATDILRQLMEQRQKLQKQ